MNSGVLFSTSALMFDEASEPSEDVSKKRATLEAVVDTRIASDSNGEAVDNNAVDAADKPASAADKKPDQISQADDQGDDQADDKADGKKSSAKPAPGKGKRGGSHLKVVK